MGLFGPVWAEKAVPTRCNAAWASPALFFLFYILRKIKISKIYVRFEKFQKYPRRPSIERQALSVFFFQIRKEVPGQKKMQGGLSPVGGRQAPLFFFLQGLLCKFEEKKLHFSPVAPHRATGVYF